MQENYSKGRELLDSAFDHSVGTTNDDKMTKETFTRLLRRSLPPNKARDDEYILALWLVLDEKRQNFIRKEEFRPLLELLRLPYSDVTAAARPGSGLLRLCCPSVYDSPPSEALMQLVRHRRFRTVFDVAILVNAVFMKKVLVAQ